MIYHKQNKFNINLSTLIKKLNKFGEQPNKLHDRSIVEFVLKSIFQNLLLPKWQINVYNSSE